MTSGTAQLSALYRARESERDDRIFHDPYARTLAGEPDLVMARALAAGARAEWYYTARTHALDRLLLREIAAGADLVVQLAAGLDARPYRLAMPASLRWVEIDAPEILEHKAGVLAEATPSCAVDRVDVDLSNPDARRGLFGDLGRRASRAIVFAEGLLIHLMAGEVHALACDLAAPPSFQRFITDIASPGLIPLLDETSGDVVRRAGAPYLFAPPDGAAFFRDCWQAMIVRSLFKTAAKLERLPVTLRLIAMMPDMYSWNDRPGAAACLFGAIGKDALEPAPE